MRIQLVKINQLSGKQASIYSVIYNDDQITLFDIFLNENLISFKSELSTILLRLKVIGKKTGARETFFKIEEGDLGDGVCALYDDPKKNLRLYCIRYGASLIIIGSGGPKAKTIRALQQDSKLKKENLIMREISKLIKEKMEDKTISFTDDYYDFKGTFDLNNTDYE
jgi:hypothetical protein